MELHNTIEDIVFPQVEGIFNNLEKKENPDKFCTCGQCRIDTACYVLNRITPHYIVSSRGAARVEHENKNQPQKNADIATLIYEGIKLINQIQRPNASHSFIPEVTDNNQAIAIYNIPTIMGRLFDGENFAPIYGVKIELYRDNELVIMKDHNWQNPYDLVANTQGSYTFWPMYLKAEEIDEYKTFEYTIKVEAPNYETLNHVFKIPVISEPRAANAFAMGRTFKLPDLYMFPPGEAEKNGYQ